MENASNTPSLRFRGYTDAWGQERVSDLLVERNTQSPKSNEYPLMAFIAEKGVAPKGERYDRSALVKDEDGKLYKQTELGDFIYSSNNLETGSIGLNKYGKATISPVYSIFYPTGLADSDFIGRLMIRKQFINKMLSTRQGVVYGQWKIHESDFLAISVAVPSLEEQRKIGGLLDKVDSLLSLHQRKLDKLQAIKKSLLQKMFPAEGEDRPQIRFAGYTDAWGQERLDQLFVNSGSGGTPLATNPNFYNGPIPFLGIADITDREITSTKKSITELGLKNSAAWIVPAGSVSLAMYASVGKVGITTKDLATSQAFYNMVFDDDFLRDFVYTRLEKADMDREWEALISTGTQRNLNAEKVRAFTIDVPSHGEMIKIAGFFKNIDSLLSLHQRKLEKLQEIKKALLQKMFC